MFFLILQVLGTVLITGSLFYVYVAWVRREELRSDLREALKDIEFTLEQSKEIPSYKHERLRLARKKIQKIMGVKYEI